MKTVLEKILTMHRLTAEGIAENTGNNAVFNDGDITVASEQEVGQTVKIVKNSRKQKLSATQKKRASEKTAWERVLTSREKDRPVGEDYISGLFEEFIEFHGDRNFGDDAAICGGIAYFQGQPVTVIAQMKGKSTSENIERNFGMPEPEGYRKALRLMKQAEKFHRPIICFVDTPGAFCGMEAEERGQGEAIARNLYEMSSLETPILSVLIGEGGSGGALGIAVANEVYMMQNAIYSVISPRGCASILWKDASRELDAAQALHITAEDLLQFDMIEGIIKEGITQSAYFKNIKTTLTAALKRLSAMSEQELQNQRYEKFRKIGVFYENT